MDSCLTRLRLALIVMVLLASCFSAGGDTLAGVGKQTIVFLRFDDVSGRSSTALEQKLIDEFRNHHFSCTFAVIPFVCDRDYTDTARQGLIAFPSWKAGILGEAVRTGTIEVALHGYSHQSIRKRKEGEVTEFSGIGYEKQELKLMKGKGFLETILQTKITTFVPPFNSYDLNTVRAMERLGFRCISASRDGAADGSSSLQYLPITCDLQTVREAVASAASLTDVQPVIGVMFHEYDFKEIDKTRGRISFPEFQRLMDWLAARKDVQVMSVNKAAGLINDLSPIRYIGNRSYCSSFTLIPGFVGGPTNVYLKSDTALKKTIGIWTQVLIFLLALLSVSGFLFFWLGKTFFPASRFLVPAMVLSGGAFLFLAALNCLHLKEPGYREGIIMTEFLGCFAGLGISYVSLRNKTRRADRDTAGCPDGSRLSG